jgi:hypothetical protein
MDHTLCFAYDNGTISMETFLYDWQYGVDLDRYIYYQMFECDQIAP